MADRIRCSGCEAESFNSDKATLYCATCYERLEAEVERLREACRSAHAFFEAAWADTGHHSESHYAAYYTELHEALYGCA